MYTSKNKNHSNMFKNCIVFLYNLNINLYNKISDFIFNSLYQALYTILYKLLHFIANLYNCLYSDYSGNLNEMHSFFLFLILMYHILNFFMNNYPLPTAILLPLWFSIKTLQKLSPKNTPTHLLKSRAFKQIKLQSLIYK